MNPYPRYSLVINPADHGFFAAPAPPAPPEPWPGPRFGGSAYRTLSQGTYWVDRDRSLVPIAGMTLDYVANVLAYLKDNAAKIAKQVRAELDAPTAGTPWPYRRSRFLAAEELVATSTLAQALGRRLADALDGKGAGR